MRSGYEPPGYVPVAEGEGEGEDPLPSSTADARHFPLQAPLHWNSGICACYDDIPTCCLGMWCPCVMFGKNVELLEGRPWVGPCLLHALLWGVVSGIFCSVSGTMLGILGSCVPCYACGYRKALRAKYNLEEAPCGDFVTHLFCHPCAVCQEHREILDKSTVAGLPVNVPPPGQVMDRYPPN